tara:strand:- start:1126 stop:1608 length:483 start_codon:yes stop_codon:yes gene_type:complete
MSSKFKNYNPISTGAWVPENLPKNNKKINKTYNIFIKDLKLKALIGIHDFEKDKKQRISINIELEVEENFKDLRDDINKVVSYEHIVNDIKKLVELGHVGLLETLAEQISSICFNDERVLIAKIKIEKLDVFEESKSVGIEILRKKNNLKKTGNILKIKK